MKDLKQKLNEEQSKLLSILCHQKNYIYFLCINKMYLGSAKGYEKCKKNVQDCLDVKICMI